MKKVNVFIASAVMAAAFIACQPKIETDVAQVSGLAAYVDPYIGSGGHGHVFVGASVPFGAMQVGPQNIHKGWDWCSGYHYSDSVMIGFSHSHLSGTGCSDLGDIQLMPYQGTLRYSIGQQDNIEGSCSAYYSHDNEQVSPGYYAVTLDNGIREEVTATERVALHRMTFPSGGENRLFINLEEGNGDKTVRSSLTRIDDYTLEGCRITRGWAPHHSIFFTLKLSEPIDQLHLYDGMEPREGVSCEGSGVKGVVTFKNGTRQVKVKVAVSSVSGKNATENLTAELPGWDFRQTQEQAIARWNREMGCIDIETPDERDRRIFYTSMYHAFMFPAYYGDVNGEFRTTTDGTIQATWKNYSVFSLWDTYRTLNPLFTLVKTDRVADMVNSMLSIYDQQGKLPIWHLNGAETECMPGYSAIPIIADAYLKGIPGFDAERAFEAMKTSATYPKQKGVPYVMERGYIPGDKVHEATSIAMEYAVGDWGIAQVARKMGKEADYTEFLKRGKYYEKYFDKSIGFIRPLDDKGRFISPYDPFRSIHGVGYFCEGNGWQYTFFVPQFPEGLISLFGGDAPFNRKLDEFFTADGDMGEGASNDITGLIGMYAHGNEPSHHIAYLYAYAGEQWKAAEKVRFIQREFYTDQHDGIIGNEDCGQMSAWHILSALGFYQVNPSNGVFVFGSPSFPKATLNLPNGKKFEVVAMNNSEKNIYIQLAQLNGQPHTRSYITYPEIMAGGTLTLVMGPEPNKAFGLDKADRPKSEEN